MRGSLSTILYILCRYALLANVLYFLAISGALGGGGACDATYKVIGVVSVLGRAAVVCELPHQLYVLRSGLTFEMGV